MFDDDYMHYEMNTEDDEPSGGGNGPGKGCLWVCLALVVIGILVKGLM